MSDSVTNEPKGKPGRKPNPLTPILDRVRGEVSNQDARWGNQDHPVHGGAFPMRSRLSFEGEAKRWKQINDRRVARKETVGWDGILMEEVYEALAETDPARVIEELEQVAAVAVNAIRSLKRQHSL